MDMCCSKSKNQIHSSSLKQLKVQANFIVVGDDFPALGCVLVEIRLLLRRFGYLSRVRLFFFF